MPKWMTLELLISEPERYRQMLERRGYDLSIVEEVIEGRNRRSSALRHYEKTKAEANKLSKERKIKEATAMKPKVNQASEDLKKTNAELEELYKILPNLILDGVPDGKDDTSDVIVSYGITSINVAKDHFSDFKEEWKKYNIAINVLDKIPKGHSEILEDIMKLVDTKQGGEVAGSRFYYLRQDLVFLDLALSLWAIKEICARGFEPLIPPYMIKGDILWGAIDKAIFEDMVYKIEDEDLNLIGTAEHALLGYLHNRNDVRYDELPIKLAGWSPCFRKEAGSHGKDTKGIFRVHQFHKVEQFIFSRTGDTDADVRLNLELVKNVENICDKLGIPHRTVNKCVGELGSPYAFKYDVEAWFPNQGRYRELASASICLDWQAYRNDMTYINEQGKREYFHTMNSTALPISRAISAIAENRYVEEENVIRVPNEIWSILDALCVESQLQYLVKE